MARVLLISDENALNILGCAAKAGHEILVIGAPATNTAMRHSRHCRSFIPLPDGLSVSGSPQETLDEVGRVADQINADVILPSSFECIKMISAHRSRLRTRVPTIPLSDMETLDLLDNKKSFWRFCVQHDVPHPRSEMLDELIAMGDAGLSHLAFPLLIKPIEGAGNEGILKVADQAGLRRCMDSAISKGDAHTLLAQECFDGKDIDFNGYAVEGRMLAGSVMRSRYIEGTPRITITDFVRHPRVAELAEHIVRTASFTGPLNIDMRISYASGEVQLIEVNPRFWDRIAASLVDDLNFVDVSIRAALGSDVISVGRTGRSIWASSITELVRRAVLRADWQAARLVPRLTLEQIRFVRDLKAARQSVRNRP